MRQVNYSIFLLSRDYREFTCSFEPYGLSEFNIIGGGCVGTGGIYVVQVNTLISNLFGVKVFIAISGLRDRVSVVPLIVFKNNLRVRVELMVPQVIVISVGVT